jgi:hypothetical protein
LTIRQLKVDRRGPAQPLFLLFVGLSIATFACSSDGKPKPNVPPPPPEIDADTTPPPTLRDSGAADKAPTASPDAAPDAGSPGGGEAGAPDGGPIGSLLDNPTGPLPADLKDVGIFTSFPDITKADPRAFPFAPRYPLWSNGLDKVRYAFLPAGTKINNTVRDAWDFPVGTLIFKTFSVKDPANAARAIPIETRLIRRVATTGEIQEQWDFQVWEWNAAGTGATLADIKKRIPREVTIDGQKFTHNIPSIKDCWNCHIANKSVVIGFDELRLNWRGPATTGPTLLDQVNTKAWLMRAPTAPLPQVTGRTPAETSALEYMQANCVHCHNGEKMPREPGARYPALDLRYQNAVVETVNIMTMTVGTAPGPRVVPGDPMRSILFQAVLSVGDPTVNSEVKPMPLVGVDRMDPQAVTLLRNWIMQLPR